MRHIFLILFVFAFESVRGADKPSAPDFSKYPQTEAFSHYVGIHTNIAFHLGRTNLLIIPQAAWHLGRTNLLMISAFPDGDRYAVQYFVTESGQESDRRYVHNWALQASNGKQIADTSLMTLRSAIRQLPAESVSPPIERLVIVSFREGTNWITRSYDSGALPKPMRQIYDIVGERFESRMRK